MLSKKVPELTFIQQVLSNKMLFLTLVTIMIVMMTYWMLAKWKRDAKKHISNLELMKKEFLEIEGKLNQIEQLVVRKMTRDDLTLDEFAREKTVDYKPPWK